ncbi:radical SAM family heme chaperone HemW [Ammonicoccus fulvus]|uniref:Heme chaperone HemW n=1 Tax=Ammonicoccus fulvus TaxID=3138240 RepID=A0ABZ3FNV9_9ACTN
MPSTLPEGDPVPADGSLPQEAIAELRNRPLSFYLHVPFCRSRCGYCDFNTYTAEELGPGAGRGDWVTAALAEVELADRVLGSDRPAVSTVFVGGGTPTLLPPADLGRVLTEIDRRFGLTADAEITTESNPDTVDREALDALVAAGFNRISFGMQSADEQVLQILDREHTAGRAQEAVAEARAAGFRSVSLDLIYGTPGESLGSWRTSLEAALAAEPDHLSAYALIIEEGTRLAARMRRGELPLPDDDDLADKYLLAESVLTAAGLDWYEVSNWARTPADQCRHNLAYWRGDNWWGVGPGAHSHIGGVRFWNVKHPRSWSGRLAAGASPGYAREVLDAETRRIERVLLELRLAEGLALDVLTDEERARLDGPVDRGLVIVNSDRAVLTLDGRLLADGVVRDLLA